MDRAHDAYGLQLLAQLESGTVTSEFIERDDGYLDLGSHPGLYFLAYEQWQAAEQHHVDQAQGRVLDIGCGAGRHSLHLQQRGLDVTAIDLSPGAVEVCRRRGVRNALVRSIAEIDAFAPSSFDTVLMLGHNFGLLGGADEARRRLGDLAAITSSHARILVNTLDPYRTDSPDHLAYHERNRQRGRMAGQIRMRVRYRGSVGEWFDYLFVSQAEMRALVEGTAWEVGSVVEGNGPTYFATLRKRG